MKTSIILTLSIISSAFSKSVPVHESNEKFNFFDLENYSSSDYLTSFHVSKRSSASYTFFSFLRDSVDISALVLGGNINDREQCTEFLESLCEILHPELPEGPFTTVLRKICEIKQGLNKLCQHLTTKSRHTNFTLIEKKCIDLENILSSIYNNFNLKNGPDRLKGRCSELETLCSVYEPICGGSVSVLCNRISTDCFDLRREDHQSSFLLQVLQNDLSDPEICRKSLHDRCLCLSTLTPTMADACLLVDATCQNLMKHKEQKCSALESAIYGITLGDSENSEESLDTSDNTLETDCTSFPPCIDFLSYCDNSETRKHCQRIKQKCTQDNSIEHSTTKVSLGDCASAYSNVDLDAFFHKLHDNHLLFPFGYPSLPDILLFLVSLMQHRGNMQARCQSFSFRYCEYYRGVFPVLHSHCNSNFSECDNLDTKATIACTDLKKKLHKLGLVRKDGDPPKLYRGAHHDFISVGECATLMAKCHYYGHLCPELRGPCRNLNSLCYNHNRESYYLDKFWDKIKKHMTSQGLGVSDLLHPKTFTGLYPYILELCSTFGTTNELFFGWCLHPLNISRMLYYYFKYDFTGFLNNLSSEDGKLSLPECALYSPKCAVFSVVFDNSKHMCDRVNEICFHQDSFEYFFGNDTDFGFTKN
ncbi:uncharacterized protein T551_03666 [Pneumocystis jirovecii RU7]|uniref:Uncharacterized protein n=1 Tax=Pneumocystis jirovecii (strain RU7) TaxID=1408657 RepID=A0A0W4ZBQ0_PNEJ7|nr:uncharacterized protein T551_03666 [Pneumocystis jirovecii RU7]KTW25830.1 hypothetical protein T551_03666 [Pneumocystis jirovecii RU7]